MNAEQFDYVIVGGGSAGCVLATRSGGRGPGPPVRQVHRNLRSNNLPDQGLPGPQRGKPRPDPNPTRRSPTPVPTLRVRAKTVPVPEIVT